MRVCGVAKPNQRRLYAKIFVDSYPDTAISPNSIDTHVAAVYI